MGLALPKRQLVNVTMVGDQRQTPLHVIKALRQIAPSVSVEQEDRGTLCRPHQHQFRNQNAMDVVSANGRQVFATVVLGFRERAVNILHVQMTAVAMGFAY
jgi:hypothetical protein